jgi:CheY-like chemotaxis protein
MLLRDQILPLFNFSELLGLASEEQPAGQHQIIVINDGVNRGGLLVDKLMGREEIVVKNLGNHLRRVRYFSGCTILGDGYVTLILDPAHVLQSETMANTGQFAFNSHTHPGEAGPGQGGHDPEARQTSDNTDTRPTRGGKKKSVVNRTASHHNGTQSDVQGSRKRKILVTDDSISIRRFISGILDSAGFEVETACDGVDALEKLEVTSFDLLLTDLEMPRMHGYELISEVRASGRHPHLPIVILTSRMGDKHSRKGLELGASAFMVKPFEQMQLLATVNSLIATPEV